MSHLTKAPASWQLSGASSEELSDEEDVMATWPVQQQLAVFLLVVFSVVCRMLSLWDFEVGLVGLAARSLALLTYRASGSWGSRHVSRAGLLVVCAVSLVGYTCPRR